jgi:branched-subunit amino acid ABC-type transport system permease component
VGSIIFVVVVVGGMGSLAGAFVGSLLIGPDADAAADGGQVAGCDLAAQVGWAGRPGQPGCTRC